MNSMKLGLEDRTISINYNETDYLMLELNRFYSQVQVCLEETEALLSIVVDICQDMPSSVSGADLMWTAEQLKYKLSHSDCMYEGNCIIRNIQELTDNLYSVEDTYTKEMVNNGVYFENASVTGEVPMRYTAGAGFIEEIDGCYEDELGDIGSNIVEIAETKKYDVAEEILRRYLTKLGMDPVEQNMLIEILREKNPNMLSTLYAVSRYSSADMDDVLEEIINYYNSNSECKMLSSDGIYKLRDIELAEYQISDLCVLDDEGEIIGIWPYYVMINAGNGTHYNDGGITIGYGHHINDEEWKLVDDEEHVLLSQYVPEEVIISGIVVNNSELTSSGNVLVDGANYVPIDEANQILAEDIIYHSNEVAYFLEENGIEVTQGQFDALVIYRFNRGRLSQTAIDYLREGNMSEEDWRAVWTGGEEREKLCQELFFGTEG